MENPTTVIIVDRNDLDGQLFGVFSLAQDLLREQPVQAESRGDLRAKLGLRPSGGIVFTTIRKFMPDEDEDSISMLSDRHNIVVIADEALRTQYGFEAKLKGMPGVKKIPGGLCATFAQTVVERIMAIWAWMHPSGWADVAIPNRAYFPCGILF